MARIRVSNRGHVEPFHVFKLIKDRFGPPKHTTRAQVMEKYQLVFVRDRVGRLADAQDFEGLTFRRDTFAPGLLEELLAECGSTIQAEGDQVVFRHLYTERRVTPLNLYLRQADEAHAIDAVLDYGQAIKDLAAANIFTGDMLLKNFGVTRHGRVIFYDYDLNTDLLRGEWDFKGLVMSDWGGSHGAVASMYSGNDLIKPGNNPAGVINATKKVTHTIDVAGLPVYTTTVRGTGLR